MRRGPLLKILATAALILAALVFYQDVYMKSADSLSDFKDRQAAAAKTLEKYKRLVSEKPLLEKKLEALREQRMAGETDLFEGQSLSISGAALQETVKTIISGGGGVVSSEKVGKAEKLGNAAGGRFMVISASFEMTLPDTNALTNVLYQIEAHRPVLVVKELYVQSANIRDPKALTARLTVSALTDGLGTGPGTGPLSGGPAPARDQSPSVPPAGQPVSGPAMGAPTGQPAMGGPTGWPAGRPAAFGPQR